ESRLADFAPGGLANLVSVHVALLVDDAERADDDFAGREAREGGDADTPVPAERPHRRLDHPAQTTEKTVALPLGVDRLGLVGIGADGRDAVLVPSALRILPWHVKEDPYDDHARQDQRPRAANE